GGTAASILGFEWYGFIGNLVVATLGAIGILWFFGKRETPVTSRHTGTVQMGDESSPTQSRETETPIYHAKSGDKK
ncbi:MAG: hypothetical protein WBC71_10850, partial [Salaquimonas sp.]